MKRPFFLALAIAVIGLLLSLVPTLWHLFTAPAGVAVVPAPGTPWQVALPAAGSSQVFGLQLPGSTLGEARARWGEDIVTAVLADPGGVLALEAYLERFDAGGVQGKLLLAFEPDAAALQRWRSELPREPTASGGWRYRLNDAAAADLAPSALVGLSFIPTAQLDAAVLLARFGEPAERLATGERLQHWLYPARGLAVALDAQGREVLQYVAPAAFERRLAAPLRGR